MAASSAERAVLYRCRTPTNRMCACGRVARALRSAGYEVEERRVPWRRSERDDVDALTGQRVVPVVVLGREAICDSRRIVEHLAWRGGSGGSGGADGPGGAGGAGGSGRADGSGGAGGG